MINCYFIEEFYSNNKQRYLGINIPEEDIRPYLNQLKHILDLKQYHIFRENQKSRDNNKFHITVLSPQEACSNSLVVQSLYAVKPKPLFVGLGCVKNIDAQTFYIIVNSHEVNQARINIGLKPKDLHVTLGFNPYDIHYLEKNKDTLINVQS